MDHDRVLKVLWRVGAMFVAAFLFIVSLYFGLSALIVILQQGPLGEVLFRLLWCCFYGFTSYASSQLHDKQETLKGGKLWVLVGIAIYDVFLRPLSTGEKAQFLFIPTILLLFVIFLALSPKGEKAQFLWTPFGLLLFVVFLHSTSPLAIKHFETIRRRAFLNEADTVIRQFNQTQERHRTSFGTYMTKWPQTDTALINRPKYSILTAFSESSKCKPSYVLTLKRSNNIPERRKDEYLVSYDSCDGKLSFPNCPHCAEDFVNP